MASDSTHSMAGNVVLGCLPCPCFSSDAHNARLSSNELHASTSAGDDSSAEEVPSFKVVPLPRQRAYPHHSVGIDDQVNCVIELLEWENETKESVAVILHGLGGTGKTTLADAVVARLDVEGWNCSTVVSLEITGSDGGKFEDSQREIQLEKPTFIYMDNVMVPGQDLHKLLRNQSSRKLRLLLTARDETVADVLTDCGIHAHVYPVRPLLSQDAMEVLCKKMEVPGTIQIPHHHMSQMGEILKVCDGVPLVVERIGAYICQSQDKDEAYRRVIEWSKGGEAFSSAEEYNIEKNGLLFDFDKLPASEKEPFLDICCFFNGWDWDQVSCIMGEDALNSLRKRALLLNKEDCENKVMVRHIILPIARNMTKGKRFTNVHDLSKALEGNELDIEGIRGIWLKDNISEPFLISAKKLDLMHDSLRVLALGNMVIIVDEQYRMQKFKQIIYFQSGLIPYIPFHPTTSQELRFLDWFPHNNNDLLLRKVSSKLKVLNLNGLRYDHRLETESVFVRLLGLRTMKLTEFYVLENLPEEIRLLTQLEELDLSGCRKLALLPEGLGDLKALTKLSLRSCESLQELPNSFGKLTSLKYLELHSCKTMKLLPEDFGSLSSLEELDLGYCSCLKEFPTSFGTLSSLKVLTLVGCTSLHHLRNEIRNLSALVRIEFEDSTFLQGTNRLVSIPCRYINLIKDRSSPWCTQLTRLPKRLIELTSLKSLEIYKWSSLERLPEGFGQLKSLVELNIQLCFSLRELSSDFHCLASLQTLNLEGCHNLQGKWMDIVGNIKTLELVNIEQSSMLEERWTEMIQERESWHFAVRGRHGQEWNWKNLENKLNKSASKLFTGECLLTDSQGEPFSLSTVVPNTVLLLLYHYPCRPDVAHDDLLRWKLLEEVVKHEHPPPFQMIYVGKYFEELSKNLAEGIMAYASDNSDAHLFFKKAFNVKIQSSMDSSTFVVTQVVADEEGRRHFSTWKSITGSEYVDFLLSKSTLYSHLKELTEAPQETNAKLLSALFDTTESRTSSIFVRNCTENIGVDQLHGKTVLLFITTGGHDVMNEHLFRSLRKIYSKAKIHDDLEILSIPIPAEFLGQHQRQPGSALAHFERTLKNVPWPVLRNPWSLKTEELYFLRRQLNDRIELHEYGILLHEYGILIVVEPNGRISNKDALPLVERWGTEVYPFTEKKMKQLEDKALLAVLGLAV